MIVKEIGADGKSGATKQWGCEKGCKRGLGKRGKGGKECEL
jgi:hypothetical protein